MAKAVTERYEEMVLEVETATAGTYAKICGMKAVTITRTANIVETSVPDCDNEALPDEVEVDVTSLVVTIAATGVWAQSSQDMMKSWFYSGAAKNIRLKDTKAAVGDIETEAGAAVLTSLVTGRPDDRGRVTAEIEIRLSGTPTRTDKAS